MTTKYQPRTQKAKGMDVVASTFSTPSYEVVPVEKAGHNKSKMIGKFVRPCPMVPRHGFVDSRVVSTMDEAEKIIAETKAADPQGELMICQHIDARHNAIWTPDVLVIGRGNDGATAGVDALTLPTAGKLGSAYLYGKAGIKTSPFVEVVYDERHVPFFTQLRDGPKVSTEVDYIPAATKVTSVVLAEGDLLAWETKVKGMEQGTVVYHPGGSLASHYAIHAILNGIPVVTSYKPEVGDRLKQVSASVQPPNYEALRDGFMLGVSQRFSYITAAKIMLVACHHMGLWQGRYDKLIGLGMGMAWRLTYVASLGENRHCAKVIKETGQKLDRDQIYKEAWGITYGWQRRFPLYQAMYNFGHESWPGSFGGMKWFQFSRTGMDMLNAFLRKDIKASLETYNVLINMAHNTGWAFNKFISQGEMTRCADNPIALAVEVAPALYEMVKREVPSEVRDVFTKSFRKPYAPPWYREFEKTIADQLKLEKEVQEKMAKAAAEKAKLPSFPAAPLTIPKVIEAQASKLGEETKSGSTYSGFHVQYKYAEGKEYSKINVSVKAYPTDFATVQWNKPSYASGTIKYAALEHKGDGWYLGIHMLIKGPKGTGVISELESIAGLSQDGLPLLKVKHPKLKKAAKAKKGLPADVNPFTGEVELIESEEKANEQKDQKE